MSEESHSAHSLHQLAQLACEQGRFAEAVELLRRALTVEPGRARVHVLLGMALAQLGQLQEALSNFDRAVASEPVLADAHGNRGDVLSALGRLPEAIESYDRAIELAPAAIENLLNRGAALFDLGRLDDAVESYDRALALAPDHVSALMARGEVLRVSGRFEPALLSYQRALAINPNDAAAWAAQGTALSALNRSLDAIASFDRALAGGANSFELHLNHGVALFKLDRFEAALASFNSALALRPDNVDALYNAGFTQGVLHRHGEALAAYETLLKVKPDHLDALLNHGTELQQLHRTRDALASYAKIVAIKPDHVEAHLNEAFARLALGDFCGGWSKFEWRLRKPGFEDRRFAQPAWRGGEPIAGKTLFLHAEQGLGDSINMVRYVPLAARQGARVILQVQPPLTALLSRVEGAAMVLESGAALPAFDVHCPLMSLPLAFGTGPDTIPADVPYLTAPPERVTAWAARLPSSGRLRIGVNWCGNPAFPEDRKRSMTLDAFAPLLTAPGVDFVSLNPGIRREDALRLSAMPNVSHIAAEFRDFADTAAVIASLDLVLTTDTAIAHLAGAMGRPLWIMLSSAPDWRFALDAESNRWYPTARLFRQPAAGDWVGLLDRVRKELIALAAGRSS